MTPIPQEMGIKTIGVKMQMRPIHPSRNTNTTATPTSRKGKATAMNENISLVSIVLKSPARMLISLPMSALLTMNCESLDTLSYSKYMNPDRTLADKSGAW